MSKVDIKLDYAAIGREVFKSPALEAQLDEIARQAAASLGEGYSHDTKLMPNRVIASVFTETEEAYRDNLENNTLARLV